MTTPALSPEALSLLPSADDVAFYRAHGYWISPVIVPAGVLDAAERGMQRYYAQDYDFDPPGVGAWNPADAGGLRKNDYASLRVQQLADLVRYPLIAATAAQLASASTIRLWHDQLLYKPPDAPGVAGNVGWHTDRQYWMVCSSEQMLTAWVAFHDVDEVGGSVSFLDGSHAREIEGLDFFSQDLAGLSAKIDAQGAALELRHTRMVRGQVSFHHCRTVHGSGPNHGGQARRSLAIHLQPGDNRWREYVNRDGERATHHNSTLVRQVNGVPDYTDPDICPVLWTS